jgi:hypothetical protein
MSLYNMVHGVNPMAGALLAALGVTSNDVPRFRDCYWDGDHICLYTRTGGGNREYYDEPNSENPDGPWNSTLRAVEGYSHDSDDEFDSTYATFYFKPSAALLSVLTAVPAADATPEQRWASFFERLNGDADDPQVQRVFEAMRPVMEAIAATLSK